MEALSMTVKNGPQSSPVADLELYFDPTLLPSFRSTVKNLLQLMVSGIEVEEKSSALSELLPRKIRDALTEASGPMAPMLSSMPELDLDIKWNPLPILAFREVSALGKTLEKTPTATQQNVPAWALFGVFFIALPMAGSFGGNTPAASLVDVATRAMAPAAKSMASTMTTSDFISLKLLTAAMI